ncbi:MAG: hypothetical protein ACXWZB_10365 [Gaiellaceae bacterium]
MPRDARARAAEIAVAAAFSAAAATLFVLGDDRGGSLPFFLSWLAVHVLYGIAAGSFWVLPIVVACPTLLVAAAPGENSDGSSLWLESGFVELFYGVPFAFMGIVARRLWQARRPRGLSEPTQREEHPE